MANTGWTRPTYDEIVAAVSEDMRTALAGAAPYVPRSVLWITARVVAGAAHVVYGALEYAVAQTFVHLASATGVAAHGAEMGVDQLPGSKATGPMEFTGDVAASVPVGTVIVRDDGLRYVVLVGGVIGGGGSVSLNIEAEAIGDAYNATVGDGHTYQPASTLTGVDGNPEPTAAIAGGAEVEDVEDWRARILARKQDPPQGGAAADYVAWANLYEPTTKAWVVSPYLGAGTLAVYFVVDGSGATILPDSGDVAAVQALIDARRPVVAAATAIAPSAITVYPTISIVPDNATNRTAVETALDALMARKAGESVALSDIWQAIGEADVDTYALTVPSADVAVGSGECAVLGTITWA